MLVHMLSADQLQTASSENAQYKSLVAELTRQNGALQMNISSLFKTAKAEIHRKDNEILSLRQRYALGCVHEVQCRD